MPFSVANAAKIAQAQPAAIAHAFARMKPQLHRGTWLAKRNRYAGNVVDEIKEQVRLNAIDRHPSVVNYIAASAPLHAADAARYLGRSLQCLSINDVHSSRHFAYYAELRAAMALLACAGIGVFDKIHLVVTSPNRVKVIKGHGTHDFVWLAFDTWAKSANATTSVGETIRAGGQSLESLANAAQSGFSITPSITNWLQDWGVDLVSLEEDRARRNESTYRPSDMRPIESCALGKARSFVDDLWTLFDPSFSGRFDQIDCQLARLALESILSRKNRGLTRRQFHSVCVSLGIAGSTNPRFEAILRRTGSFRSDSPVFSYAKRAPKHGDPELHFSMIARGAFLLRLALGTTAQTLVSTGLSLSEIAFWINDYGANSGIWASTPTNFIDLWLDIDQALAEIRGISVPPRTSYDWARSHSLQILTLGEFERVAAWAFAPP